MRTSGLWILAILITLASAVYQWKTGPTYPVKGSNEITGSKITYKLLRSHGGEGDQPVVITVPDTSISGFLIFKRYKTNEKWSRKKLVREGKQLKAALPHQPPTGKLEYYIELAKGASILTIPGNETIITRFKGAVPLAVLILHIFFIFFAMLLSTRTGIESFRTSPNLKPYALWTIGLLFIGGLILGPIVQKYAFGVSWTGIPYGADITNNKTLIAFVVWLIALIAIIKNKKARPWTLFAALITLTIFMIPHSVHGSELDYSKIEIHAAIISTTLPDSPHGLSLSAKEPFG
ncbi:MAG: hypothetical protein GWP06_10890 [Actinobacteria bacterium]|nr:hypothetical protein [Actinomycetota bacterium]